MGPLIEVGQDPPGVTDCRRTYECECEECANCTPRVDGGTVCVAYLVIVVIGTVGFVAGFVVGKLC